MRRREFLGILCAVTPISSHAQQSSLRTRRIGVLAQDLQPGLLETFLDELHKLGYVEGRSISIELRNAEGRNERLPALAEELLRLKVEVIVAVNTPAVQAAKTATNTIPVVMMRVADPVKSKLVTESRSSRREHHGFELYARRTWAKGGRAASRNTPQDHAHGCALSGQQYGSSRDSG